MNCCAQVLAPLLPPSPSGVLWDQKFFPRPHVASEVHTRTMAKEGAIFHTKCGSFQSFPAVYYLPREPLASLAALPYPPKSALSLNKVYPLGQRRAPYDFATLDKLLEAVLVSYSSRGRRLNGETATTTTTKTASTKGNETPRVKPTSILCSPTHNLE